jgi:hypothetical protein
MGAAAGPEASAYTSPDAEPQAAGSLQRTCAAVGVSEFVAEEGRVLAGLIYSTVVPAGAAG